MFSLDLYLCRRRRSAPIIGLPRVTFGTPTPDSFESRNTNLVEALVNSDIHGPPVASGPPCNAELISVCGLQQYFLRELDGP
jgi:hypothetical protein